jgi:hypothetical protein
MVGLILPALFGAVLALIVRRPGAGAAPLSVCWRPVAAAALVMQVILFTPPVDHEPWAVAWGPWLYVASMVAVCAVLVRSALASGPARFPWLLAALGVGLNVIVVTANGGYMPQSPAARQSLTSARIATDGLTNVVPLTDESRLPLLADIIAQPSWMPLHNVISVGDLLLAGGVGWGAFLWAGGRRRRAGIRPATMSLASR